MRIFGMILATVGAAIIVYGLATASAFAQVARTDAGGEAMGMLMIGGPIAAVGLLIVALRKPEKR